MRRWASHTYLEDGFVAAHRVVSLPRRRSEICMKRLLLGWQLENEMDATKKGVTKIAARRGVMSADGDDEEGEQRNPSRGVMQLGVWVNSKCWLRTQLVPLCDFVGPAEP